MNIKEYDSNKDEMLSILKTSNDHSVTKENDVIINIKVHKSIKLTHLSIKNLINSQLSDYSNEIYYHEGSVYVFVESEEGFSAEEYSHLFGCKSGLHFPFMHDDRNIFLSNNKVHAAGVNGGVSIAMGASVFGKAELITSIWAKLPLKFNLYNE